MYIANSQPAKLLFFAFGDAQSSNGYLKIREVATVNLAKIVRHRDIDGSKQEHAY